MRSRLQANRGPLSCLHKRELKNRQRTSTRMDFSVNETSRVQLLKLTIFAYSQILNLSTFFC